MSNEWKLVGYNDTNQILGADGDFPIPPGGIISSLIFETEEDLRIWLECWKKGRHPRRKAEVYNNDILVETHILEW